MTRTRSIPAAAAAALAVGLAAFAAPAAAQTVMAQLPALHPAGCRDFRAEPDGRWTALVPVTVEMMDLAGAIGAGQTIQTGTRFAGYDLGDWLDRHCPPARTPR